ncbi:putative protein-like [Abeliophyllum distichum]|uniref:Uncharacterized protein n=1 Tax=Abeliophyllum distichum TaxID=126358 RepID=A0ABD1RCN4_9LAMI
MSGHIRKTSNRKHRTSCFLGCFGISVMDDEEKKISTDGGIGGGGGGGKEKYGGQRISRSSKEIHALKKDKNLYATSDQLPAAAAAAGNNLNKVVAAEPDQVGRYKSSEVTTYNNGEQVILENVKSLGGENRTIRYDVSRPTRKQLPKSVSEKRIYGGESNENDAKFGSLVGISIIMDVQMVLFIEYEGLERRGGEPNRATLQKDMSVHANLCDRMVLPGCDRKVQIPRHNLNKYNHAIAWLCLMRSHGMAKNHSA